MKEYQRVHFIGIGGIGMSALAKLFAAQGKIVTGSDAVIDTDIVRAVVAAGISVHQPQRAENIVSDTDLVVYSSAVMQENPERVRAQELGIKELSYAECLGEVSKLLSTLVVTGTHGKSTTTALLGLMLEAAGYDPTVLVGSLVPGFALGNLRIGQGRFFVVEGCEYRANMLNLEPEMIVLTNIEEDHLDYYRDLDHIRQTFQTFVDKLRGRGLLVWNADDAESRKLVLPRAISCGTEASASYRFVDRAVQEGKQSARFVRSTEDGGEEDLGMVTLIIPGEHNMRNALEATATAVELGIPFDTCRRVLAGFKGIWRRFERLGTWNGAELISDYGHHPTAIRETLRAAREFFPGRRIVLCHQPHQHSRTKELLSEFVVAMREADVLVVPEIYEVKGRTEVHDVSSRDIVSQIDGAHYAVDFGETEAILRDLVREGDVLIVQGAGDIDGLARKLVH